MSGRVRLGRTPTTGLAWGFTAGAPPMTHAVDALKEAMEVLGEAIEDHKEGTLLQAKIEQTVGCADRSAQAAALQHAVQLGERFLDALFLRLVLAKCRRLAGKS